MMPQSISTIETVSGARKAAMFLMGVGDQVSAELLRQLDPDDIRRITAELSAINAVPPDHMLRVFREFEGLAVESRYFAKGGAEWARRLLEQALGPETAQRLLDAPRLPTEGGSTDLGPLHDRDPQQLAKFLSNENPQTVALVLSNIPPEQAGPLMSFLPSEMQGQVALRIACLDRISPEVFRRIAEAIGSKLKALRPVNRPDGVKSLAALLNHMDRQVADTIVNKVTEENQVAGTSVRDLMFVFEDIINIDKEGMKALIAKCDRKALTIALKGTTGKLRDHFTQCMSQRAAEMLVEDMEALGPIRIRDVKAAQQQLVAQIRLLQQEGAISGSQGVDEYVV
jgi:flagellar motor switch protein FliG